MGQSTVSGVLQLEHYKPSYLKYLPLQDAVRHSHVVICTDCLYKLNVALIEYVGTESHEEL